MDSVKKIKNNTEKMWFLGTDVLEEKDWQLMEENKGTSFSRDEGAIYYVDFFTEFKEMGYSSRFLDLIIEAKKRKYIWIFFDRDITTTYKK